MSSAKELGICRCCQSEGLYTSLSEICPETNETYTDLIKNNLNVTLLPLSGDLCKATYLICEECIMKLKSALAFRQQVQRSEDIIHNMYTYNTLRVNIIKNDTAIKEEDAESDDGEYVINDCSYDDVIENSKSSAIDTEVQYKRRKKSIAKKTKNKIQTCYTEGKDFTQTNGVYTCLHCEKSQYTTKGGVVYHIKSVHFNIYKFPCNICPNTFKTKASAIKHKLEKHNIDERVQCKACNKYFYCPHHLNIHINSYHKLGKVYKCNLCDFVTYRSSNLNKHKFNHVSERNYHCQYCSKRFKRKSSLNLHERIHTGDRRKVCKECGQAFVQKASLNYHMTKYHPEVQF